MKINSNALADHLRGFQIPRVIAERVREAISLFIDIPTATAISVLPHLREVLDQLSEHPSLTKIQKVVVRKSYLVMFGDSNCLDLQLKKEVAAINTEPVSTTMDAWPFIRKAYSTISQRWSPRYNDFIESDYFRQYRKLIERKVDSFPTTGELANHVISDLRRWSHLPECIRSYSRWSQVFPGVDLQQSLLTLQNSEFSKSVGNIGCMQEPGMKLRLYASPHHLYQAYLNPIKCFLQDICSGIMEDCHRNQDRGRELVQQQLIKQRTVFCYDLSSATHLFPWSLQLKLLKMFGIPDDYIQVLDFVVKSEFSFGKRPSLKWKVGQPLGIYPSFFAFSLAHHLLIRGCFMRLGKDYNGGYVLLGDDIAIFDESVAKLYVKMMDRIGCKINLAKSVISNEAGEFAGSYIDRRVIFNVGKFRVVDKTNVISYNMRWTNPTDDMKPVVSYIRQDVNSESRLFIDLKIKARTIRRIKHWKMQDPNRVFTSVVNLLSQEYQIALLPVLPDFSGRIPAFAEWILKLHADCPQCWVNSPVPYYLSKNMIVLEGIAELVAAATTDGYCNPIWWLSFCKITRCNSDNYSHFRLMRCATKYISELFLVPKRETKLFERDLAFLIIKYTKQAQNKSRDELVVEINKLISQLALSPIYMA